MISNNNQDDDDEQQQQQQQQQQQNSNDNNKVIKEIQEVKIKKRIKYYLYCLDFDGVLCDSVNETFYSGLRACALLWSTSTSTNTNTNTDDKLKEEEEEEKEKEEKNKWLIRLLNDSKYQNHILNDFRYIRPILYVGWESILLIKLLCTSAATPTATPTPVREKILIFFHNNCNDEECSIQQHNTNKTFTKDYVMKKWKLTEKQYSIAMSDARKSWIKEGEGDKDNELKLEKGDSSSSSTTAATATTSKSSFSSSSSSWIDAHGFYDGACQSVRKYLDADDSKNNHNDQNDDIYIITTKAKEFALKLLQKQNLVQPPPQQQQQQQHINVLSNASATASASTATSIPFIKESNVYGLGSGPKADVIKNILYERNQHQHQHRNNPNENKGNDDDSNDAYEYEYEYEYIAIMVEDNIATLDKIMNKSSSLSLEEEEEEDITGSGNNNKIKVIPVVASWGYNTHEQLINVININKYLVLPPSLLPPPLLPLPLVALTTNEDEYEDNKDNKDKVIIFQKNQNQNQNQIMSSKEKAQYCKETDPTGSSLSIIFHNYRNN